MYLSGRSERAKAANSDSASASRVYLSGRSERAVWCVAAPPFVCVAKRRMQTAGKNNGVPLASATVKRVYTRLVLCFY